MPEPHEPERPDIADDPTGAAAVASPEPVDTLAPVEPVDDLIDAAPVDDATGTPAAASVRVASRRRARPDAVLMEARDVARAALADIARDEQIGAHRGTTIDGDRLVTHAFASLLPGYVGWNWFAVLARTPRSRTVTVCEIGLTPGEGALLAPPWVPWADRLRPEDQEAAAAPDAEHTTPGTSEAEQPASDIPEAEHPQPESTAPGHTGDRSADQANPDAATPGAGVDRTEIVDDDATLLSRPEVDHRELPGEEDDEPAADLSAEAEDVRAEADTEDAVADAAAEATEA
ncbi:hypothetical protein BKD30_08290 [Tersicoccus phoenicis]|uniref:DUF3027 domain-containing protein n=1 Tax=Tersicoccus phoenicis TaxID=554083 RepID=A0A1R1LAJ1_9MICC|nr:DUF3027 domain-containing protein [Tersicoccus phoenicis]OMH24564.1 hypothetical protein BKD30_08290 [Tersicoccus phoenicis]